MRKAIAKANDRHNVAEQIRSTNVQLSQLQSDLHSVLATLSEREASIVKLRFGLINGHPHTRGEIGGVYGLTQERIRQIEAETMTKLRKPSRAKALRDYLG